MVKKRLLPWVDSSRGKHSPGEGANCGEKDGGPNRNIHPGDNGVQMPRIPNICQCAVLNGDVDVRPAHTYLSPPVLTTGGALS